MVSQEPVLFGLSIKDNILYGRRATDEMIGEDEVIKAAKNANGKKNAKFLLYETNLIFKN